jgi:hypothetical protein
MAHFDADFDNVTPIKVYKLDSNYVEVSVILVGGSFLDESSSRFTTASNKH